jgi:small subunit ribosomal protein S16
MSTRIRLRRLGAKKRPFYRVVVADQRSPRDGRFIENIGIYHPLEDPSLIEIDEERALHWLRVGAQPSDQVRNLMVKTGIWDRYVSERPSAAALVKTKSEKPAKVKLSKKAAAKAVAEAEAPEPTVQPVAVAEEPEPTVQPVAVAEEPEPTVEPVAVAEEPEPTVEPVAVAEEPALEGEAPAEENAEA